MFVWIIGVPVPFPLGQLYDRYINTPHLHHPAAEGSDVSSARETSAAQLEDMVSKTALAVLEDPKFSGILGSVPVNIGCQFLREVFWCCWKHDKTLSIMRS